MQRALLAGLCVILIWPEFHPILRWGAFGVFAALLAWNVMQDRRRRIPAAAG